MTADAPKAPRAPQPNATEIVVGDFHKLLGPDSPWDLGGFALPDGSTWQYKEPGAVILVRNGWLQVSAVPYRFRWPAYAGG